MEFLDKITTQVKLAKEFNFQQIAISIEDLQKLLNMVPKYQSEEITRQ